jgi:hypothetical protein
VKDWVETAPTPVRRCGQDAPTARLQVVTATAKASVAGSWTTMDQVTSGYHWHAASRQGRAPDGEGRGWARWAGAVPWSGRVARIRRTAAWSGPAATRPRRDVRARRARPPAHAAARRPSIRQDPGRTLRPGRDGSPPREGARRAGRDSPPPNHGPPRGRAGGEGVGVLRDDEEAVPLGEARPAASSPPAAPRVLRRAGSAPRALDARSSVSPRAIRSCRSPQLRTSARRGTRRYGGRGGTGDPAGPWPAAGGTAGAVRRPRGQGG